MENLKPIEPGCLAMVIDKDHLENHGKIVTVGNYLGKFKTFYVELNNISPPQKYGIVIGEDVWEVSEKLLHGPRRESSLFSVLNKGQMLPVCPQNNLMRIDGYEEDTAEILEKSVVTT